MVIKKFVCSLLIVLSFALIPVLAQSPTGQNAPLNSPYLPGETLTYEGKYSKLILRGIDVADLSFSVERIPETGNFLIRSKAVSKGGVLKLFNFKFDQSIESLVDGQMFHILQTVKRDEQGDRVRDSEALFDYPSGKVTYIETDPNDLTRPPRQMASPIETGVQDMISGAYLLRQLPLEVGKTFDLRISDSGLVYKVPVKVTEREKKKSILGKKWCFRLEPDVFGEGRLIEREGKMIIWITDDKRRLPVQAQINTSLGKVVVKLKKIENKATERPKIN
ncbi:MAG: DUF3108 domain-containing protein [Pyrinomonadaceae bacterium]